MMRVPVEVELVTRAIVLIALFLCTFGVVIFFIDFEDFMEVRR